MLSVFFFVFRHFLAGLFTLSSGNKSDIKLFLSGFSLLNKRSFRLKDSDSSDPLLLFKEIFRTLSRLFEDAYVIRLNNTGSKSLLIDGNESWKEEKAQFIFSQSKSNCGFYLNKNFSIHYSGIFQSVFLAIALVLSGLFLFPFFVVTKRKVNTALLLRELFECVFILSLCRKEGVKKVFDLMPYEKDSNILAYILMRSGIEVIKVPSPGPLMGHNNIVVGSSLAISSGYHKEEVQFLKEKIQVDKLLKWEPKFSSGYIDFYKDKTPPTGNSIGFYSSASWVRKENEQISGTVPGTQQDEDLLFLLRQYCKENPEISLVIFLHPKEKGKEMKEGSKKYYDMIFQGLNYSFADSEIPSSRSFHTVNLGIGIYSTILFERLYCGCKTVFAPFDVAEFPISGSSMNTISAKSKEQLFRMLKDNIEISASEFFQKHGLNFYRSFSV